MGEEKLPEKEDLVRQARGSLQRVNFIFQIVS